MENPAHAFGETGLVLQLVHEFQIKINTVMRRTLKTFVFSFISIYSALNKLSECIYLYISKKITSYIFYLFLKSLKARMLKS